MSDCDIGTHIQENKQQQANLQKKIRCLDTYLHHWVYLPGMSKKLPYMLIRLSDICEYTQSCTCKCIDYGTLSQQNPRILKYHFPICTGKNSINPHNSHTLYTFFLCFTENVKIKLQ